MKDLFRIVVLKLLCHILHHVLRLEELQTGSRHSFEQEGATLNEAYALIRKMEGDQ